MSKNEFAGLYPNTKNDDIMQRIDLLMMASAGGHWEQLMILRAAATCDTVHFATTQKDLGQAYDATPCHFIPDCNRRQPLATLLSFVFAMYLVLRLRPRVFLTTGALPGLATAVSARLFGSYVIWVDSIANASELSMSGKIAKRVAHMHLSQWEDVAITSKTQYAGRIL